MKKSDVIKRHNELITKKNKIDESWYNGIFDRYENPVLTDRHIPPVTQGSFISKKQ